MKFAKDSKERLILSDFYRLYEDVFEVGDSLDYWVGLIQKINAFQQRHKDGSNIDPLAKNLCICLFNTIEERYNASNDEK